MKIVVDENIPFAREVFENLGEVHLVSGRAIDSKLIWDVEILVLRSITKVDADLLRGSRVKFVGTATAGTDHIDQAYLKSQNILFASAAGANADSVSEYVITALLRHAQKSGQSLKGRSLGIIGVGNIGSRLEKKASALGLEIVLNDSPLARKTGSEAYRSLKEACACDFISLHVPLIYEGCDATFHLFDKKLLESLNPETVLINSSRGEVINHVALLNAITSQSLAAPILDVWENEPDIMWKLIPHLEIGTPHIAGYAIDGKIKGTILIYEALCAALGTLPALKVQPLPLLPIEQVHIDATGKNDIDILYELCTQVYDLRADHERLLALLSLASDERPSAFDRLRKEYPMRREFQSARVSLKNGTPDLIEQISGLGFRLLP